MILFFNDYGMAGTDERNNMAYKYKVDGLMG
jgi:hypothetical protein